MDWVIEMTPEREQEIRLYVERLKEGSSFGFSGAAIEELLGERDALTRQVEGRRAELGQLLLSPEAGELTSLRLYLSDTSEDMECLPNCDSYGHESDCPVTNVMAAFRQLREQIQSQAREIERLKAL